MNLLRILFCTAIFFFANHLYLWAAHSEISVAYHGTGGKTYNGCKVTFQVYEGTEAAKKRVWTGQLSFYAEGLSLVNISTLSRAQYDSEIKIRYLFNPGRYNALFGTVPPLRSSSPDRFIYEETAVGEDSIIAGNIITWRLNNHPISIQDVVDTVNTLRDGTEQFPKYKLYGYDWDNNVANCVTFSCRFLRAFGVNINACTELTPWLVPTRKPWWAYLGYYVFGGGLALDHVRLRNAVIPIAQHHRNVRWRRGAVESDAPRFALRSIGDVLDAKDMHTVETFIRD